MPLKTHFKYYLCLVQHLHDTAQLKCKPCCTNPNMAQVQHTVSTDSKEPLWALRRVIGIPAQRKQPTYSFCSKFYMNAITEQGPHLLGALQCATKVMALVRKHPQPFLHRTLPWLCACTVCNQLMAFLVITVVT